MTYRIDGEPIQPTGRPNILFILADDMGWGDVGFHGSRIRTPNLDRLARTGLELTQHYVTPLCTPTRVGLLTGRHPGRFGRHATTPTNDPVLPDGYPTLAAVLRDAGYDTALFGKWHLGSDPRYAPNHFGFDESYGSLAGGVDPYTHRYKRGPFSHTWHRNGQLLQERGHVTDLTAHAAAQWITDRSPDKPWFCYVPFTAVHTPIKPAEHWLDHYESQAYDADPHKDESFKRYAAYTSHMDHAVGMLIESLKLSDQYHNTLVVFTSDNGALPEEASDVMLYPGWQQESLLMGSNHPLRGRKAQMYEGGIRTPTLVRWPGVLDEGAKRDAPLHITDWMPTFVKLAGARPSRDPKWDGRDVWPILSGEAASFDEDRPIYWNLRHQSFAVRLGQWKLILTGRGENAKSELFNLAADPCEQCDLAQQEPGRVAALRRVIEQQHALDDTDVRPDMATAAANA